MIKTDCYWYDEERDMGAHIPDCRCKKTFPLDNCDGCTEYHSRYARTNADLYRSYSDEKMAELFNQIETEGKAYGPRGKAQWLDWLRQEAT